ncbi:hypothetical protein NKJ10_31750, partial [Mesorhizobium sp. M0204]
MAAGPWIVEVPFLDLTESFSIRIKKVVALHLDRTSTRDDPLIVARHGKLPPRRHEELPPQWIAEERANER